MAERAFVVPADTPEEWVPCHSSNHWMEWIPVTKPVPGVVNAWWRCVRCTTERYDQLHPVSLEVLRQKYRWPDGYRVRSNGSPVARQAWKATYLELMGALSKRQATRSRRYHKEAWKENNG